MAVLSKLRVGISLFVIGSPLRVGIRGVASLKFAPGSPCATQCFDSRGRNSSGSGIKASNFDCFDGQFENGVQGQKFKRCLNCLQHSTWQAGGENDQNWFLYNLRVSLGHCIFGYPNGPVADSSPCATPSTCGHLKNTTDVGAPDSTVKHYAYCAAGNAAIMSNAYDACLECVKGGPNRRYLSNFLVALRVGCQQQPPYSLSVGLNSTVFTNNSVGAIPRGLPSSEIDMQISTGIVIGVFLGGFATTVILFFWIFRLGGCRVTRTDAHSQRVRKSSMWPWHRRHAGAGHAENTEDPEDLAMHQQGDGERRSIDLNTALGSHPVAGGPARAQQVNMNRYLTLPPQALGPRMNELMEHMERITLNSSRSSTVVPGGENSPRGSLHQGRPSPPRNETEVPEEGEEESSPWGVNQAVSPYGRNRRGAPVEPLRVGASNFQVPPGW